MSRPTIATLKASLAESEKDRADMHTRLVAAAQTVAKVQIEHAHSRHLLDQRHREIEALKLENIELQRQLIKVDRSEIEKLQQQVSAASAMAERWRRVAAASVDALHEAIDTDAPVIAA